MTAVGVLIFIASVLFSIGLHELGHLATAKRFGIKVEQYFIGFGPKIWSTRRGETEYGVKAIPFGGFVRIAGMNPFEEVPPEDRDRVFKAKKPWQRAIVLAAGSFTHFVVALGIIATILAISGRIDLNRPTLEVAGVTETVDGARSPAARADIRRGDRIVAIDGNAVSTWAEAVELIKARPGQEVVITVERDGARMYLETVLADHRPQRTEREGFLGVGPQFEVRRFAPHEAVWQAGKDVGSTMQASLSAMKNIFAPSTISRLLRVASGAEERSLEDPTTLVGAGGVAGGLARERDFVSLFMLIAAFNVFIGVANLVPLPPLDGGHLAVLTYEKVRRRDVDMRKLLPLTATVVSVLGALFFLLLYLDIVSPLPPIPG